MSYTRFDYSSKITAASTTGALVGGAVAGPLGSRIGRTSSGAFVAGMLAGSSGQITQNAINSPQRRSPMQNNSNNFGRDIGFYCGACRNFSKSNYGFRGYRYRR